MNQGFEWDSEKEKINIAKHGVSFEEAKEAFDDAERIILMDKKHSLKEARYFCIGRVKDGIITVRYTMRNAEIRIIGAAYWRGGRKLYEKENRI